MKATLIGGRAVVAAPLGSARPTRRDSLADSFTLGAASGSRALGGLTLTRYSTLPRVSSHMRAAAAGSTDPPSVADNSVAVSSRDSGCSSSRSNPPSFHTSCIAAGTGSPSRTVNTTLAPPRWTI